MEERIRQRRALYTVLQEWLDETSLLQALQIFEDQFQGRPSIALHEYLTRIAPLYQGKVEAKQLRRRLMEVLVRRSQDLAPDPLPQLQQKNTAQTSARFNLHLQPSAEQLALHELISSMLRNAGLLQRKQLHAHVASQLKSRFRNGSYDQLAQYMLSGNPQYLAGFDDRSLRDFLSLIYVAACEVLGPVPADRWLADQLSQLRERDLTARDAVNRFL